jgi:hypothetical protein
MLSFYQLISMAGFPPAFPSRLVMAPLFLLIARDAQPARFRNVLPVLSWLGEESLSVDSFPEPAAIRNVWENELALVKSERIGAVIATEGQRERFTFNAPVTCHRLPPLVGSGGPVLNSPIGVKDQMFIYRACIADSSFSPMTDQSA